MRLVRDEALMWLPRPKSTYSVLRSASRASKSRERDRDMILQLSFMMGVFMETGASYGSAIKCSDTYIHYIYVYMCVFVRSFYVFTVPILAVKASISFGLRLRGLPFCRAGCGKPVMTCEVGTKMPVGTILRLGSECGLDESLCGEPNCVL